MSIKDILQASESGTVNVFAALIGLVITINFLSGILGKVKKNKELAAVNEEIGCSRDLMVNDMGPSAGQLKLIGVDEKTAAMIMAIVSDETDIPLAELQFISIKALDEGWGGNIHEIYCNH